MQQTETYKLNLIDPADVFSPDPLNDNARKLDAALAEQKQTAAANKSELDTALAAKAPQSEIGRLETALNAKAPQTEIARLETTLTEQQKTITANKTEVDAALKTKAAQTEIARLETALKDKAAQSEITRLETALKDKAPQIEIARLETALNANAGMLEELFEGQLQFKIGTYTGNGTHGAENPKRLEFDFKPLVLIVTYTGDPSFGGIPWMRNMNRGIAMHNGSGNTYATLTWEDRAVSWYSTSNDQQLNTLDGKYGFFALGCTK